MPMNMDLKRLANAALHPSGPLGANAPHPPLTAFLLAQHAVINKANDSVSLTEILDGYKVSALPIRVNFYAYARFRAPQSVEVSIGFLMLDPSGEPVFFEPGTASPLPDPNRGFNATIGVNIVLQHSGVHTAVLLYNGEPIATETVPVSLLPTEALPPASSSA